MISRVRVRSRARKAGRVRSLPLLNELGFNSDWIEKCLAHEDGRSSRGVYNKAEYEVQRRHMMQEWSNIIDAWVAGQKYVPVLIPPSMPLLELDPALSPAESAVA
jgi:hypothetical protein